MRAHATVAITLFLTLLVLPVTAAQMVYPCYRLDAAPVLDGQVDGDPAWAGIPAATGFSRLGAGFTEAKQTRFQACWDEAALYLAIVCEEPDVAHLTSLVRDGGEAWLDDGVELFLQPGGAGPVFQFVVTSAGSRASGAGAAEFLKIRAATSATSDSYTLEIAVPHEIIQATPEIGARWRGNICRNIFATNSGGDQFTCWAPLVARFLEPENFATFDMRGAAPGADQVGAIEGALNARYRAHLKAGLREVAAQGQQYLPTLEQVGEDADFGPEARRLRHEWARLERAQRNTDAVRITQLRELLTNADALLRQSYEVSYAYLIAQLFTD